MTFLKAQVEVSEFKKRLRWMNFFAIFAFFILVCRLLHLQIMEGERYYQLSQDNIIREVELPSVRGIIRDVHGRVLATNRPSHNLYITPHFFDPDQLPRLASFLELNQEATERLRRRIDGFSSDDLRRFQPFLAYEDINRNSLAMIETYLNELSGIRLQSVPVRTYPYGELTAHLIGYVNEVSARDLELWQDRDYRSGDIVGRVGIERSWEEYLYGRRGWRRMLVDARGVARPEHEQRFLLGNARIDPPKPGNDLTVTIDVALQRIVERALRGHPAGAVVIEEVHTGRILAMVSKPSFDPNSMTNGLTQAEMDELRTNPLQPLFFRPLMGAYSPGSTFKIITALGALEEGIIIPSEKLFCGGFHELGRRSFRCSQAHGEVDLRAAIIKSCNVYFYRLAERQGMMNTITHHANLFGFGRITGMGMGETSGGVDSRENHPEFRLGHALNAAIGQGQTVVTVLQLAMAYGAIANRGTLYEPRVVRRIEGTDGSVVEDIKPRVNRRLNIVPEHLDVLIEAMIGVVASEGGTAHEHEIEGIDVAGKTGTAEVPRNPPPSGVNARGPRRWFFNRAHGWFAGFAPAHRPEIAIAVLIEHGGAGGRSAAPVAMRIFRDYFQEIAPLQGGDAFSESIADAKMVSPAHNRE